MPNREPLPDRIARRLSGAREYRAYQISGVELRDDSETSLALVGHASVFDTWYPMYGGKAGYGWDERVADGAFAKTLREKPDVELLVNHQGLPLARTKSGTLHLDEDSIGLRVNAALDPDDPDVRQLRPKMHRGDLDEMSFAFRVIRQEWNEDYTERTLTEISLHRGDVSIVSYGANPYTSVDLRGLLAETDPDQLVAELRAVGRLDQIGPALLAALRATTPPLPARPDPDPEPAAPETPAGPSPAAFARRLEAELLGLAVPL